MSDDFVIRRGDTLPVLEITCTDGGAPVDLSAAEKVTVHLKPSVDSLPAIHRDVPGRSTAGVVVMDWLDGDTAQTCTMRCEVEVLWPTAKRQTFPVTNKVQVFPDLGQSAPV